MTDSEALYSLMENQHIDFVLKIRELSNQEKEYLMQNIDEQLLEYYKTCFWDKDFEELTRTKEENNQRLYDWAEENIELSDLDSLLK